MNTKKTMRIVSLLLGIVLGLTGTYGVLSYLSTIAERDRLMTETLESGSSAFYADSGEKQALVAEDIVHIPGTVQLGVTTVRMGANSTVQVHTITESDLGKKKPDFTLTQGSLWVGNPAIGRTVSVTDGSITAETLGGGFLFSRAAEGIPVTVSCAYGAVTVGFAGATEHLTLLAGEEITLTPDLLISLQSVPGTLAKSARLAESVTALSPKNKTQTEADLRTDAWKLSQELQRVVTLAEKSAGGGLFRDIAQMLALYPDAQERLKGQLLFSSLTGITEGAVSEIKIDEASKPLLAAVEPLTRLIAFPEVSADDKKRIASLAQNHKAVVAALGTKDVVDSGTRDLFLGKAVKAESLTKSTAPEVASLLLANQVVTGKPEGADAVLMAFLADQDSATVAPATAYLLSATRQRAADERMRAYETGIRLIRLLKETADQTAGIDLANAAQRTTVYQLTTGTMPDPVKVATWQQTSTFSPRPLWSINPDGTLRPPSVEAVTASTGSVPVETSVAPSTPEGTTPTVGSAGTPTDTAVDTTTPVTATPTVTETVPAVTPVAAPSAPETPAPRTPKVAPAEITETPALPATNTDGRIRRPDTVRQQALEAVK